MLLGCQMCEETLLSNKCYIQSGATLETDLPYLSITLLMQFYKTYFLDVFE